MAKSLDDWQKDISKLTTPALTKGIDHARQELRSIEAKAKALSDEVEELYADHGFALLILEMLEREKSKRDAN